MIKTNQAFKDSLDHDIEYLEAAMKRPFAEVDYREFDNEFVERDAERLNKRAARLREKRAGDTAA